MGTETGEREGAAVIPRASLCSPYFALPSTVPTHISMSHPRRSCRAGPTKPRPSNLPTGNEETARLSQAVTVGGGVERVVEPCTPSTQLRPVSHRLAVAVLEGAIA